MDFMVSLNLFHNKFGSYDVKKTSHLIFKISR